MRGQYSFAALLTVLLALTAPAGAAGQSCVNVQAKDALVSDVIRTVCAQCRVRCVIDGRVIGKVQGLSLSDVPLETALEGLARYAGAKVELQGNVYYVRPKEPTDQRNSVHGG